MAVTLETNTLPVCAHFRILYACVTSCFLLFTFFGASPVESRASLVQNSFWWVFIFLFCLFCLPSLTRACRGLFLEPHVMGLAPKWRSQDCGSRS